MSKRRIGSLIATILFFAAMIAAALNVQHIQDIAAYYQYEPSSVVASLASESGMSEHGTFLFYVSQPALQNAEAFNQQCQKKENSTAILGCYDGHRIYIYDISDQRLAGVRPTTAAHEMLHAAYKRLSHSDKEAVNSLLDAEYEKFKDDEELADRMAFYARTQPGERENELHSIIGTEVRTINPELEKHYRRYFSDRSKVVAQHEQYHSLFEELHARSQALDQEIERLKKIIKDQNAAYNAQSNEIKAAIDSFKGRADRGEFASQAAFNIERQGLLDDLAGLEDLRATIEETVNVCNALVDEFNEIALEANTLNRSMDSQLAPAPSL